MRERTRRVRPAGGAVARKDATLGERVRLLRKTLGMTMAELAVAIGKTETDHGYISQLERNLLVPSADVLADLALALRVSSDYLLGIDSGPPPPDPELLGVDVNFKAVRRMFPEEAELFAEQLKLLKRRAEREQAE